MRVSCYFERKWQTVPVLISDVGGSGCNPERQGETLCGCSKRVSAGLGCAAQNCWGACWTAVTLTPQGLFLTGRSFRWEQASCRLHSIHLLWFTVPTVLSPFVRWGF